MSYDCKAQHQHSKVEDGDRKVPRPFLKIKAAYYHSGTSSSCRIVKFAVRFDLASVLLLAYCDAEEAPVLLVHSCVDLATAVVLSVSLLDFFVEVSFLQFVQELSLG